MAGRDALVEKIKANCRTVDESLKVICNATSDDGARTADVNRAEDAAHEALSEAARTARGILSEESR